MLPLRICAVFVAVRVEIPGQGTRGVSVPVVVTFTQYTTLAEQEGVATQEVEEEVPSAHSQP